MRADTFVYFVRPIGYPTPIKIGCSASPVTRLEGLMTWSPLPLEIIVTVPGGLDLEARIHGLFRETHSRREWFHASPPLLDLIASLVAGRPIGALIDLSAPIIKFRPKRSLNLTPDRRLYRSYSARVRIAFKPFWSRDDRRHKLAPDDVDEIMGRWGSRPERKSIPPTPAEFARLEEVIANPALHGVTAASKWRREAA